MTKIELVCSIIHGFVYQNENHKSFEGVSFKLTSSWPPARERGVASCSPDAASGDPRDPGESSGRLYSMRRRVQIDTFARNWASNFHSFTYFRIVSHSFA